MDSKVEYDVTLYSEVGNLFGKIGNNLLSDLDFDDSEYKFNHTFDRFAVGDRFAQSNFFKNDEKPFTYFYPIVHNGYNYENISGTTLPDFSGATVSRRTRLYTPTTPISGWTSYTGATSAGVQEYRLNSPTEALYDNQLKPAINIYSLIHLIFKTYGYTISSDFFNTPWMKSLYMYGYYSSDATKFGYKIVSIDSLPLEGVDVIFSGTSISSDPGNAIVVKKGTGIPCYCLSDIYVNMVYENAALPDKLYLNKTISSGLSGLTYAQSSYTFLPDESISINTSVAPASELKYYPAAVGSSVAFTDGDYVNFSKVIDESIKQIDLLSSIAKKFNLVFVPDPEVPKQLIIEPFDFYIGTGDVHDWTDKISYDSGITVEPALNYVESELLLTDQEDGDEGNREFKIRNNRIYGRSLNPNPTDFKTEKKTIDTIFSPELVRQWDQQGPQSGSLIGLPLGINYAASSEQSSFDNQIRWLYQGVKTKPKLFYWLMGLNPFIDSVGEVYDAGVYNTYTVKLQSWTGGTTVNYDRIPSVSHTMPMGLEDKYKINNDSFSILFDSEQTLENSISLYNTYTENDAYNTFYKNRITNIYNPNTRFLTGKFNLNYSDVANLKANDVIKLKNQYFIVNKLNEFNYTNSELTSVELLQFNVNPQNYPTRYFKYYYCQNPSVCFVLKTDFTNPNIRSTNFIWSIYYDNQVGSLTGSTTGFTSAFKVFNDAGYPAFIGTQYFPYTMQEITEAEYNSSSCYDFTQDALMQYIYQNPNGPIYSLAGFWENSSGTKTGVNVWENCADFYSDASLYGITTGNTATYGPAGYCFNDIRHFNGTTTGATAQIREVKVGRNGTVFVGGNFRYYNNVNLGSNYYALNLFNNGVVNTGFTRSVGLNVVNSIEIDPTDKIYIGDLSQIFRFNENGTKDTTFNGGVSGVNGAVYDIEILRPSLKLLIGGGFTTYNSTSRVGIAKINTDGSLDTSFNSYFTTGVTFTSVRDIDVYESGPMAGKIVVVGYFTQYSGVSRNGIVVLNSDGTLYSTFNPGTGFPIQDAVQVKTFSDGTILCSGNFQSYNGVSNLYGFVKLNSDGSINGDFNPQYPAFLQTPFAIDKFAIQSDGKIICYYDSFDGTTYPNYIIRLNADGSYDYSYNIARLDNRETTYNIAESIEILGDDSIYVGGYFRYCTIKGVTKEVLSIVKLDKDGDFINCG